MQRGTPESYKTSINPKHSSPLNFTGKLGPFKLVFFQGRLTFAGSDVVQVQLVALLGALQGAFGGKEVAGGLVCLVVSSTNLSVIMLEI